MPSTMPIEFDSSVASDSSWTATTVSTRVVLSGAIETLVFVGEVVPNIIPEDELYYWTAAWQAGEQATLAQIEAGEGVEFDNAEDLIRWLHNTD